MLAEVDERCIRVSEVSYRHFLAPYPHRIHAAVGLNLFVLQGTNDPFDPFITDPPPIRSCSGMGKVASELLSFVLFSGSRPAAPPLAMGG